METVVRYLRRVRDDARCCDGIEFARDSVEQDQNDSARAMGHSAGKGAEQFRLLSDARRIWGDIEYSAKEVCGVGD